MTMTDEEFAQHFNEVNDRIGSELGTNARIIGKFAKEHGFPLNSRLQELVIYLINHEEDSDCVAMRDLVFEMMAAFHVTPDKSIKSLQGTLWGMKGFLKSLER